MCLSPPGGRPDDTAAELLERAAGVRPRLPPDPAWQGEQSSADHRAGGDCLQWCPAPTRGTSKFRAQKSQASLGLALDTLSIGPFPRFMGTHWPGFFLTSPGPGLERSQLLGAPLLGEAAWGCGEGQGGPLGGSDGGTGS